MFLLVLMSLCFLLVSHLLMPSWFCLQQKVGFFNQQYADQLNMEETATEYLMRNFNLPYQDSRKCLGRFGLESHAHTIQISKLSGMDLNICHMAVCFREAIFNPLCIFSQQAARKPELCFQSWLVVSQMCLSW